MQLMRKYVLTSEIAREIINKAEEKAKEFGVRVCIAVVDDGGNLLEFRRMTGAPILSIGISQNKAYTAIAFGLPTSKWYELIKDEPALLHGIVHTPRLVIFAGGVPIKVNGQIIGGIGVSGATAQQDEEIALAGISVVENLTNIEQ
ncbi:GlcG/HbpS family heme-binding protein [Candidatus Kryptobacter tengchongensis]|uniref:Uncharacterized conserved protein GlcG, DUF336 family n=1 Tax=Kryptobacter tengchongensis TaxID=1643429 RepID=A0A656D5R7_KRYT1|nr:heme-binding protein [Candidatus Kryptobacter tengchongensis]CUS99034.1 Uncharacterized conserved protein GlcG, DUF336 family [Candidatus Kryptobacter tengchongensis]CUT02749.1 Uncharacterized conserved protein GlcG, DUF336 family [Candidatus Kryptobacter tengchongensis]